MECRRAGDDWEVHGGGRGDGAAKSHQHKRVVLHDDGRPGDGAARVTNRHDGAPHHEPQATTELGRHEVYAARYNEDRSRRDMAHGGEAATKASVDERGDAATETQGGAGDRVQRASDGPQRQHTRVHVAIRRGYDGEGTGWAEQRTRDTNRGGA